jgi:HD superfamily phosphohydrolase YqeK
MSTLEKIVFIADKIETGKAKGNPAAASVRQLAQDDLDAAVLQLLNRNLVEASRRGWPLHPDTVAARNELLPT